MGGRLKMYLIKTLRELQKLPTDELLQQRYDDSARWDRISKRPQATRRRSDRSAWRPRGLDGTIARAGSASVCDRVRRRHAFAVGLGYWAARSAAEAC